MKRAILVSLLAMIPLDLRARELSNPPQLFDPVPYAFSHVATVPAGRTLVFVAGQGGEEDAEGRLSADFRAQVRQALRNVRAALRSRGVELSAVVKVTTLVVDHDAEKLRILVEEFQEAWPGKDFPVNTLIPVPRLALDRMRVEIDAVAVKG